MYTYFVFTVFYYLFCRTERLPTQGGRERVLSPEQETEIMNHARRYFPRCMASENIACDVDEVLWPDRNRREDAA